jgi:predicted Fe-Mo cluster-binding NifX family protein
MKIAVTAVEPDIDALIDSRFGRGAFFVFFDSESGTWEAQPNPASAAPSGAGTRAAQLMLAQKVDAIISGDFGPNARAVLDAVDMNLYIWDTGDVRSAINALLAGQLPPVSRPAGASR